MAWNEPGKGDKDPWGGRDDKGPPDIDEVVRKMQRKLGGIFGGGSSSDGDASSSGPVGFGLVLLIAFFVWILSGIDIVESTKTQYNASFSRINDVNTG